MQSLLDYISDVRTYAKRFLQEQARQMKDNSAPLILKMSYGRGLMVQDRSGEQWAVNELYLNSFHNIYRDKAYQIVRLLGWSVDLKFNGKKCTRIDIVSSDAEFYSRKDSKRISACHFMFTLAEKPEDFDQLDNEVNGYLNRIGKRELCSVSHNIHKKMKTLLGFAVRKAKPIPPPFEYHPWKKVEKQIVPLDSLSPAGLQLLQKVRHFVKIDHLMNLAMKNNLSGECNSRLQQLLEKPPKKEEQK